MIVLAGLPLYPMFGSIRLLIISMKIFLLALWWTGVYMADNKDKRIAAYLM